MNPTYNTITSLDSKGMYSIWGDLDQLLKEDTLITKEYSYVSVKYDPSLTEQMMNGIVEAAFGSIPILGEMNLGIPDPGEVEHIALFKTRDRDAAGYYRLIEMKFNYGIFKSPSGAERAGPTFVELTTWEAEWPNDENFVLGNRVERKSAP